MTTSNAWRSRITVRATPDRILDTLTDSRACARWSPIPFTLDGPDHIRLRAGTTTRVSGRFLGARIHFEIATLAADQRQLQLHARGPIDIHVEYTLTPSPAGCALDALVAIPTPTSTHRRIVAHATRLLLATGTLDHAVERIARVAEQPTRPGRTPHPPAAPHARGTAKRGGITVTGTDDGRICPKTRRP